MPSVDVIIPCYMHGRFLHQCVESVLRQESVTPRILIIDNASTDGSGEIAKQLARHDARVEARIHAKNLGAISSLNEGLGWVSSDYLMILAADDWLTPGALSRALEILEHNPDIVFAYGREVAVFGHDAIEIEAQAAIGVPWRPLSPQQFVLKVSPPSGGIGAGAVLVRASAHKRAGLYRENVRFAYDLEMLMRIAVFGRVAELDTVQGVRRVHEDTQTAHLHKDVIGPLLEIEGAFASFFASEGATLPGAQRLHRRVRRNIASCAYWRGWARMAGGRFQDGLALLRLTRRMSPSLMFLPPVDYLAKLDSPLAKVGEAFNR